MTSLAIPEMQCSQPANMVPVMELSIRIREIRNARGLTLADLAERACVSVPHMSEVERGIKNLNNHLIERIAEALEVEPYQLFIAPGHELEGLLDIVGQLKDEDRSRLLSFADALAASSRDAQPD